MALLDDILLGLRRVIKVVPGGPLNRTRGAGLLGGLEALLRGAVLYDQLPAVLLTNRVRGTAKQVLTLADRDALQSQRVLMVGDRCKVVANGLSYEVRRNDTLPAGQGFLAYLDGDGSLTCRGEWVEVAATSSTAPPTTVPAWRAGPYPTPRTPVEYGGQLFVSLVAIANSEAAPSTFATSGQVWLAVGAAPGTGSTSGSGLVEKPFRHLVQAEGDQTIDLPADAVGVASVLRYVNDAALTPPNTESPPIFLDFYTFLTGPPRVVVQAAAVQVGMVLTGNYTVAAAGVGGAGGTAYDDTQVRSLITAEKTRLDALVNGADTALDTLLEIDNQLKADEQGTAAILSTQQQHTQQLLVKADLEGGKVPIRELPLTQDQLNAILAATNPASYNAFATLSVARQIAQDALNTAPLIVVNAYNGLVRTDFTKMYDASLFSCQNDAGTNGGYGGYGGYFAINRPLALAPGDHFPVNIDGVLDLQNQPLNLNGGWLDIHSGGKIINNRLIYNGSIRPRDIRNINRPAIIQGGIVAATMAFFNQGATTLLLDNVVVSRMNYAAYGPANYMTDSTAGGRLKLRNGSRFDLCAPDPATIVTTEPVYAASDTVARQLAFQYPAGSADGCVELVLPATVGPYTSEALGNVATHAYTVNGTATALPFTAAPADTVRCLITRTDTTKGAYVLLTA